MAVEQCEYRCFDRSVRGFWQRVARLLQQAGARLERWQQLAVQRRQLREMDDRLLKDIGLSRADVTRVAARHFWDDPAQGGKRLDDRYRSSDKWS